MPSSPGPARCSTGPPTPRGGRRAHRPPTAGWARRGSSTPSGLRRLPNPASSTCGPAPTASGGSGATERLLPSGTCAACATCTFSCRGPALDVPALALSDAVAGNSGARAVDGDAGPMLDRQALAAYRRRLGELDGELAEARAHADLAREERLDEERARCSTRCGRPRGWAGGHGSRGARTNAPGSPSARPSPPPSTGSRRSTRRWAGCSATPSAPVRPAVTTRTPTGRCAGWLALARARCGRTCLETRRRGHRPIPKGWLDVARPDPPTDLERGDVGGSPRLDTHGGARVPAPGLARDRHRPVGLLGDDPLPRRRASTTPTGLLR